MSDVAVTRAGDEGGGALFRLRTSVFLSTVGGAAFVAMLVATAYAPGSTPRGGGAAHALSNSALGYSGIVRLAQATGHSAYVIRDDNLLSMPL